MSINEDDASTTITRDIMREVAEEGEMSAVDQAMLKHMLDDMDERLRVHRAKTSDQP